MGSLNRILAAVDGSDTAARGLRFAIERAKRHGATLDVAYAVNRASVAMAMAIPYGYVDPTPMLEAIDADADDVLGNGVGTAKAFDVPAAGTKLEGPPAEAIVVRAKETRADLVVIGSHSRRGIGRLLVGSVAEGVIRTCAVPAFVVPPDGKTAGSLDRAVVCIDGSPASDMALAFALRMAEIEKTHLTLCTVVEPQNTDELYAPFLQAENETKARETLVRACEIAANTGVTVESQLLHGDAVAELSIFADRTASDCLFTGTHGRGGIPRWILGSVASGLLQSCHLPVCTVRHR